VVREEKGSNFEPTLWAIGLLLFVPFAVTLLLDGRFPASIAASQPLNSLGTSLKHLLLFLSMAQPLIYLLARKPSGVRLPIVAAAVGFVLPALISDFVARGRVTYSGPIVLVALFGLAAYAAPVSPRVLARICAVGPACSVALLAAAPHLARFGEGGSSVSRSVRLAGVYSQPNEVGAFAALAVVLFVAARPAGWKRWDKLLLGLSVIALILSESYTSWIAAGIGLLVLAAPRRRVLLIGAVGVLIALAIPALQSAADLQSVHDRQDLWRTAVSAWHEQPTLGMGPTFWSRSIQDGSLPKYAVHAHNQALDLLATTGVLGLAAAIFSLLLLFRAYRKLDLGSVARRAGLALLAVELARSITEVPFNPYFGGGGFLVLAMLIATAIPVREARTALAPQSAGGLGGIELPGAT